MSVAEDEQMFEKLDRPKLRLLTGGKGPPIEPPLNGPNWLADQEIGTSFVARHQNSKEVDYNQYFVLFKHLPEVVLLKWILPDGKLLDYYVDPERFSKKFQDYVILGVNTPQEHLEDAGGNDGNSDRSD